MFMTTADRGRGWGFLLQARGKEGKAQRRSESSLVNLSPHDSKEVGTDKVDKIKKSGWVRGFLGIERRKEGGLVNL